MKRQRRQEPSQLEDEDVRPNPSQAEGDLETVEEDLEMQDDELGGDDDDQ